MHIDTLLLILESVLLVATIILLIMNIREGRGRDTLLVEVSRATKVLTRHEYFMTVMESMNDAVKEVSGCITGRFPSEEDKKLTNEVIRSIERLVHRGVRVRYLLPRFQDRLHVGWLYTKAGAEVRYSSFQLVHDFRYIVVDDKTAVIGVPEHIGAKEATKKGYKVPSEGLAAILKENFENCWKKNVSFEDYIRETLNQTGATIRMIADELKVDEKELRRISGIEQD